VSRRDLGRRANRIRRSVGSVLWFLLMAALCGASAACSAQGGDGRSRQRVGLRLTGLGKTASVELPVERRNKQVTYVFGGTLDVRRPPSTTTDLATTTIATYSTEFEPALFKEFTDGGAFIEDVSFDVSEAPSTRCNELAVPRRVVTDGRAHETTVVPRTFSGRAWTETADVVDLTETHLRRTSQTLSTRLADTDTCVTLSIHMTERTAPRGSGARTKYWRYDSSPRALDANARMRARAVRIAQDAAASFAIK
jgi:hypothetical protein